MLEITEKLYYTDAYIKDFEANVLSAVPCDGGFDVVLDKTAFFPEEGGQSSDTGSIGGAKVIHVYEKNGVVHHITETEPSLGVQSCKLNFEERFEKMQLHTAEHILCGIFHKLYGVDNVGFHLGADEVTFDISAPLTRTELDIVENAANEAVFSNVAVETLFPTKEELSVMEYRSKLDLTENVRIVKIGDVDACACCAPHVAYTGEIGLIKMLHFEKHRGGTRIWMTAGARALSDYRTKYENILRISAMLSVPNHHTAVALEKYISDTEQLKYLLKQSRAEYARLYADSVPATCGNAVYYLEGFSIEELRSFSNAALPKISGMLVALGGAAGDYKYIISSNSENLAVEVKEINVSLGGRGGGKPTMVQGTFTANLDDIKKYFLG